MSDQLGGWSPTRRFEGFDEPFERRQWFLSSRVNTEGKVPTGKIAKASAQRWRQEQEAYSLRAKPGGPGSVNWTPIGPSVVARGQPSGRLSVSGRITALAVGPGGSRIYAGAANGGTWFSSDCGTSWVPLDDYSTSPHPISPLEDDRYGADSLAIGALAVSFGDNANSDTIFVGTGEPSFSEDAYLVYAATSHGLYQRSTSSNVTEWNLVDGAFTDVNRAVTDLIVAGRGPNICYYAAFRGGRVYRSLNGIKWAQSTA